MFPAGLFGAVPVRAVERADDGPARGGFNKVTDARIGVPIARWACHLPVVLLATDSGAESHHLVTTGNGTEILEMGMPRGLFVAAFMSVAKTSSSMVTSSEVP